MPAARSPAVPRRRGDKPGQTIRSFVAVDPSPQAHAALVALKADLAATGADVRWVRDANLHCTLKFLGAVEAARLDRVRAALDSALAGVAPIEVAARGVDAFPSLRRPRIVWVGLEGEGLGELAVAVEASLVPLGFRREDRAFAAHITLGRVRGTGGLEKLAQAMAARAAEEFGAGLISQVSIYRSELRPGGSVYTPLWTIPLRASSVAGA